ncbi:sigma-70 family RNA polymerase sigma factor, partial [Enterococcus faecalis]|nr:sigma-70 family RNA polymerase sigma factor [Enterococcus faecalis]
MSFEYEKIEAQFAKYLKKVIHNTATNYYKKKYYHQKYELLLENFQDYSADFELNGFFLPT